MVSTYIYVPMLWTEKHPNYKWPLLSQTAHSQLILPQDTVVLFVDFKMHMIWRKEKQEGNKKNHQPITTCVVMFWIFFFCHKHLQGDLYISMGACYKPYKERNVNFAITISKILPALPPCWKCLENSFFQPAFRSKKGLYCLFLYVRTSQFLSVLAQFNQIWQRSQSYEVYAYFMSRDSLVYLKENTNALSEVRTAAWTHHLLDNEESKGKGDVMNTLSAGKA